MTSIEEVPDDLSRAIEHAQKVLNWYGNLAKKEIPPRYMWPFDDLLISWFERVEEERDRERNPGGSADSASDWEQNEYARGLR